MGKSIFKHAFQEAAGPRHKTRDLSMAWVCDTSIEVAHVSLPTARRDLQILYGTRWKQADKFLCDLLLAERDEVSKKTTHHVDRRQESQILLDHHRDNHSARRKGG